jgi:hypothetical protein
VRDDLAIPRKLDYMISNQSAGATITFQDNNYRKLSIAVIDVRSSSGQATAIDN